jgi:hypothetical protein
MGTLKTAPDPGWNSLYRIGGICLLITGLFYFAAVVLATLLGPPPADAEPYLRSLATHPGLALANYAGFAVADLLLVPATLALYLVLRHLARSAMLVGTGLIIFWLIVDLAVTEFSSLTLVMLSRHPDAQSIAAAHFPLAAMPIATFFSFVVSSIGTLIVAMVMLKGVFSKVTAWAGIVACVEGIVAGFYVIYPPLAALLVPCMIAYGLWGVLAGARLFRLGTPQARASEAAP